MAKERQPPANGQVPRRPRTVSEYLSAGDAAWKAARRAWALTFWEQALRLDPACPAARRRVAAAYYGSGLAHARAGRTRRAIALLARSYNLCPTTKTRQALEELKKG